MKIFKFMRKAAPRKQDDKAQTAQAVSIGAGRGRGGWFSVLEPFAGAWQRNIVHYEMSPETAEYNAIVWACMTRIAGDVARLPLTLQQKLPGRDVWLDVSEKLPILNTPDYRYTGYEWRERLMMQLLRYGNAYALKTRKGNGEVLELKLLNAERVSILQADDGSIFYQLNQDREVGLTAATITVPERDIIHFRINTMDKNSLVGLSPIMAACTSGQMGETAKLLAVKMMRNASTPKTIISLKGSASQDVLDSFREAWDESHRGNPGSVSILNDEATVQQFNGALFDGSLIKAIDAGDEQIAKCFGLAPGLLNGTETPTGKTQQYYLSHTLAKYLTLIEQRLMRGLWYEYGERADLRLKFNVSELLKADPETALDMSIKGVGGGVFTLNEARAMQNLPPLATGGDTVYLQQQNYSVEALAKRDQQADPFSAGTGSNATGNNGEKAANIATFYEHRTKATGRTFDSIPRLDIKPEPLPAPEAPKIKGRLNHVIFDKAKEAEYILKHKITSEMDLVFCDSLTAAKNCVARHNHEGFIKISQRKGSAPEYIAYILKKKHRKQAPDVMHAFMDVPKDYKPQSTTKIKPNALPVVLSSTVKASTRAGALIPGVKYVYMVDGDGKYTGETMEAPRSMQNYPGELKSRRNTDDNGKPTGSFSFVGVHPVMYKDIPGTRENPIVQYKSVAKKRGPKGVNRVPVTYR